MDEIFLSVVIPCFDEMANLQKGVLDKVIHFFEKRIYKYELIIVDDGSTDGSKTFIRQFAKDYPQIKLIENNHLGKAGAVTTGVLKAKGKYILFTDMDQATPIEEVDKLLPYFNKSYNIVIGSRNKSRKGSPGTRLVISWASMVMRKAIVGLPTITDTQCGFKMFTHDVAKVLFKKIYDIHHGFKRISGSSVASGFDVEMLFIAQKMGYKIREVPIIWLYVETRRVNPIRDSIEGLKDLLRIKLNDINHIYS